MGSHFCVSEAVLVLAYKATSAFGVVDRTRLDLFDKAVHQSSLVLVGDLVCRTGVGPNHGLQHKHLSGLHVRTFVVGLEDALTGVKVPVSS